MSIFLKQSTAVDVAIGPFLDAADGVTAEDSLTIAQADVRLKKNNSAWAQVNDATSATHEENGWYEKELDATDTNTVGRLLLAVHEAGALPVWHEFWVLEEAIFDALFAASATGALPVSTGGIAAAAFASGAVDAAALAADAVTEIQSGLATAANLATVAGYLDTEVAAILAAVDTEVAAILADTNELQTDLVNGGRLDLLIDAIKAKTDTIPVSPAAVGSAMTLDLTQALDLTPTADTVGDALLSALAQGSGTWTLVDTTLTLKNEGGTTLYTFDLDDADAPTSRTRT